MPTTSFDLSTSQPSVSIVVPVRNEADNIAPLIAEIGAALDGRWAYEIIYVNDGSTDATGERLAALMAQRGNLRQLRHARSGGQSAAVRSGVRAARGAIVATLDGKTVKPQTVRYADGTIRIPATKGTHRLVLSVSDYEETKNMEDVVRILPNTATLRTSVTVR